MNDLQRVSIIKKAKDMLDQSGIIVTEKELSDLEIAEYGLGRWDEIGLQIIVYVNTQRCCAKEMILFENQICPEHRHPVVAGEPGKEETFRCRFGEVYLYVPGPRTPSPRGRVPEDKKHTFTVWNEILLRPGDQYTLMPDTLHWFQAGPQGAIISEFSTQSRDETDIFTDPDIVRVQ